MTKRTRTSSSRQSRPHTAGFCDVYTGKNLERFVNCFARWADYDARECDMTVLRRAVIFAQTYDLERLPPHYCCTPASVWRA